MPEKTRASWGRFRQVGATRGKLGQVGATLNLHNAAIVFCCLCALFTIYDNMKSGFFLLLTRGRTEASLKKKRAGLGCD